MTVRVLLGLSVLLGSLLVATPVPGAAADPDQVSATPAGRYIAIRTMERGSRPRPQDVRSCRQHFGQVQGAIVPIELDAHLFSFTTHRHTGVVRDETARRLGRGYMCVVVPDPTEIDADLIGGDAYAVLPLPTTGRVELDGRCALIPSLAQPAAAFFNCRLRVLPNQRLGVVGGFVTSNSILNPAGVPGNPTGSIWTAYVVRRGWPAEGSTPPASPWPGVTAGDAKGQRTTYVVARARRLPGARPACPARGHALELRRVQPRLNTGELRGRQTGDRVGRLTICTPGALGAIAPTVARASVTGPAGHKVTVRAFGRCHDLGRAVPSGRWQRTCAYQVLPDLAAGVQGGLITTVGLADQPASRVGPGADPHVTISLLPSILAK